MEHKVSAEGRKDYEKMGTMGVERRAVSKTEKSERKKEKERERERERERKSK